MVRSINPTSLAENYASAVSRDGLRFFNLTERTALASFATHSFPKEKFFENETILRPLLAAITRAASTNRPLYPGLALRRAPSDIERPLEPTVSIQASTPAT